MAMLLASVTRYSLSGASRCATALLNAWVSRFGLPEQMTSDRGSVFTSDIWSSLAKLLGVKLRRGHQCREDETSIVI